VHSRRLPSSGQERPGILTVSGSLGHPANQGEQSVTAAQQDIGQGSAGSTGGRTVWVTGAGSGVGRAVAVSAASAGSRVVLTGRRAPALAETADLVQRAGGEALQLQCDTTDPEALDRAYATLTDAWGAPTDVVLRPVSTPPSATGGTSR
jgi:shikimate 5-dehydrogenase